MNIQVVEPTACIGMSAEATDTTLAIASILGKDDIHKFDVYRELWVDNGAFESGIDHQVENFQSVIIRQCMIANEHVDIGPTHFALPDEAGSCAKTIALYNKYQPIIDHLLDIEVDIVAVPQGRNMLEFEQCIDFYKSKDIHKFGFSVLDRRWMRNYPTQADMFDEFANLCGVTHKDVHVLGFDLEDLKYKGFYKCDSVDSTYPLKTMLCGVLLGQDIKRPADYFSRMLEKDAVVKRVKEYRDWLQTNETLVCSR